jgi:hypothetical protein
MNQTVKENIEYDAEYITECDNKKNLKLILSMSNEELINLIYSKDNKIAELNCLIKTQKENLDYHRKIIEGQHYEILQRQEQLNNYRFYKSHPKDLYKVEFGHKSWKTFTYRFCISTRVGRNVCQWVINKKNIKSTKILEFKQYLEDVKFGLEP